MAARFADLGLGIFLLVSLVVGVRLLALARRTRRLPELLVGAGFVVGGAFGYVPENLVADGDWIPGAWRASVAAGASAAIRVSAVLVAVFTWRVFRPRDAWAPALVAVLAALLAVGFAGHPGPWPRGGTASQWWWSLLSASVRSAAFAWAALESWRAARAARRRAALGLAAPRAARRLLLWSVAMGAVTLMSSTSIATRALALVGHPLVSVWESLLGLVAAAAMARTFLVRRRAAPAAVAGR
jgi:hypothetical protein